jgi:hypothetical protein
VALNVTFFFVHIPSYDDVLLPSKWSLYFLLSPVVYSLFLLARTELYLLLHPTELTVHVTCLHASTNCTTTVNISTLKGEAVWSSEASVRTYKSVWYHNTMTTNRIYYKTDTASLSGQWKWEEVVARFEIMFAVLHKHINPGKQTFRISKDCDIKQAPWSVSCLCHRTRISCLRVIELYTSSEDREVYCVVAVLIPLIRNP